MNGADGATLVIQFNLVGDLYAWHVCVVTIYFLQEKEHTKMPAVPSVKSQT